MTSMPLNLYLVKRNGPTPSELAVPIPGFRQAKPLVDYLSEKKIPIFAFEPFGRKTFGKSQYVQRMASFFSSQNVLWDKTVFTFNETSTLNMLTDFFQKNEIKPPQLFLLNSKPPYKNIGLHEKPVSLIKKAGIVFICGLCPDLNPIQTTLTAIANNNGVKGFTIACNDLLLRQR